MKCVKRGIAIILAVLVLPLTAMGAETIVADPEMGIWTYETQGLKVQINRVADTEKPLIWYEVHLFCSDEVPLVAMVTNEKSPGATFKNPFWIARTHKYVFAINDDYFGDRVYNKKTPGVVIRDGKIVHSKTHKKTGTRLPNLDTMALYPDGDAQVFECAELTAREYIDKGAQTVLSFGPILIRDGEMNAKLEGNYTNLEPRIGFGLVDKHHYVCVVVEGRHTKSKGSDLMFVAQKLLEMGARQAINLDGGQTSTLMFMGEKLNKTGKYGAASNLRNLSSMLAVGHSDQVPDHK